MHGRDLYTVIHTAVKKPGALYKAPGHNDYKFDIFWKTLLVSHSVFGIRRFIINALQAFLKDLLKPFLIALKVQVTEKGFKPRRPAIVRYGLVLCGGHGS